MLWWLVYTRNGRLAGVAIIEAGSLIAARMRANLDGIAPEDAEFGEGHELDENTAKAIPARQTGRMLTPKEAATLLDRIEQRRGKPRTRSK